MTKQTNSSWLMISSIVCTLLVISPTISASTSTKNYYDFWYDVPSAPLKFKLPHRNLKYAEMQMLNIQSLAGTVASYDLGCVRKDKQMIFATETVRSWQLNQPVAMQFFTIKVLEITSNRCTHKGEQLGVVRVQYEDGGVWQLEKKPAEISQSTLTY